MAGLCGLGLVACSKPGAEARPTAEAFLDSHYVRIDLEGAKAHASVAWKG